VNLDTSGLDRPHYLQMLSLGERRDSLAMTSERLRRRFLGRKVFHRLILSNYLGTAPQRISFSKGRFGRPELPPAFRRAGLRFNASSSGTAAVLAVSRAVQIGVDIEEVRPRRRADDIVRWVAESWDETSETADDGVAFVRNWTRLEARVKWSGTGLAQSDGCPGDGWSQRTMTYRCAAADFVLSLVTRHSSVRIQGPIVVRQSRAEAAWRR
jgi:4'-phosphopantetheinyl transferase